MSNAKNSVRVIGLVGGIASGKSLAAAMLVELGAARIDADKLGHELLSKPRISRRVVQEFGESVLDTSQDPPIVSRSRLADLVFGRDAVAKERLRRLEAILHPEIHAEAIRRIRKWKESDSPPKAIVMDVPLLLEANWAPACDFILFLDVPPELRLSRAFERGWSEQHFRDREAAQMSISDKRAASTHIVPSTDEEQLRHQLRLFWEKL